MITVVSLANLKHPRDAVRLVQLNTDVSLNDIEQFALDHFGLEFEDLIGYYHSENKLPHPVNWQAHTFWHFIGMLRKTIEAHGGKPVVILKPMADQVKWQHLLNRFWLGKQDTAWQH